ncbi:MAG: OprO/OprP family phosphate-selective porin [Planctomycetes bacterium]|nr:OprO/OprP family phosphate-selective porin [Planctomycetota bacterium]
MATPLANPLATTPAAQDPPGIDAAPRVESPARWGYDDAFFVESADGRSRLAIGGVLNLRTRVLEPGGANREGGFELERMRLEFSGRFDDAWIFQIEPRFTEDRVELDESWFGVRLHGGDERLLVGRPKAPFGLEELLSSRHFDFATRSLLNQFSPGEDHGVVLLGGSRESRFEWGFGITNGTGTSDTNGEKDLSARFVVRPWIERMDSSARRWQFGCAATWGREDDELDGKTLSTEAKTPFLAFEPGANADGERLRVGLETAWFDGPFTVQAEALSVAEELQGAGGAIDATTRGWYVSAAWMLTGEEKGFGPAKPARPFTVERESSAAPGGHGAWQLAARVGELRLDGELVDAGLVAPNGFADRVLSFDCGVNWYATNHVKAMLHVVHTEYAEPIVIDGESESSESALVLRLQLHF